MHTLPLCCRLGTAWTFSKCDFAGESGAACHMRTHGLHIEERISSCSQLRKLGRGPGVSDCPAAPRNPGEALLLCVRVLELETQTLTPRMHPFGPSPSPADFNGYADAAEEALRKKGYKPETYKHKWGGPGSPVADAWALGIQGPCQHCCAGLGPGETSHAAVGGFRCSKQCRCTCGKVRWLASSCLSSSVIAISFPETLMKQPHACGSPPCRVYLLPPNSCSFVGLGYVG